MTIYDLFNKKIWVLFSILYILILCKYFFINNIPFQFDSNIFILAVICLFLFISITIILYVFIGSIERFFMLNKYDKYKNDKIFKNFDTHVIWLLIPTNILIFFINFKSDSDAFYLLYFFISLLIYLILLLIIKNKEPYLYLNSIFLTILFFYQTLDFNGILFSFLFLFFLTISIFLFIKNEDDKINNEFKSKIYDLNLYKFIDNKIFTKKEIFIYNLKIHLYGLAITIIISFFIWDIFITKNKVVDFISQNSFKIAKIGSFKCNLMLNNIFKNQFNDRIEDYRDTFLVEVEVIWVNNNDIFIRYNGKSIKIKQDQILAIEY